MRVVAPTSVNGGRSIVSVRAAAALPHDDVEPEVFERRIEDLLRSAAEPVDLVDEDDVARLDRGEDRGDVLPLERRPGDRADADAELLAEDVREARLAETGRADEEDVVERLASPLRRVERDRELLLDALLADELVEPARAEAPLELFLVLADLRCQERCGAHAALFNASRTRSSGGRSSSTSASARSASRSDQPSSTSASRATTCESPDSVAGANAGSPSLSFRSSTIRSAVFLPTPGIAWKRAASSRTIARRNSPAGEPDTIASATFGPTPLTDKQLDEELALLAVGEAVELHHVLADVEVRVDGDLVGRVALAHRGRRRVDEVADAADVEDEPFRRVRHGLTAQARDHEAAAIRRSGGAIAWQIATASASAAWFGVGISAQAEDHLHHPLHLRLVGAPVAADRLLDAGGRVLTAGDSRVGGRDEHGAARLPDGERDAGVGADV